MVTVLLALLLAMWLPPIDTLRSLASPLGDAILSVSPAEAASDMNDDGEGVPHGVPLTYSWVLRPSVARGNSAPEGFNRITAWGQVYEEREGTRAANVRVEIRDISLHILSKQDGSWSCVQRTLAVDGAAYREDFVGDRHRDAELTREANGGVSVSVGNGFNFHFWPQGRRKEIEASDIDGVFVVFFARLVPHDDSKPGDFEHARFVANAGADYWIDGEAGWDNFKTNAEVGMGRFKWVTRDWRAFTMTTLTKEQIERHGAPTLTNAPCR